MMDLDQRIVEALKQGICDNCLGRTIGNLLSGLTNEQRGKIARAYIAFVLDSGTKLNVYMPNFYGTKFRNLKVGIEKPEKCEICQNFFRERIDEAAKSAAKKLEAVEFSDFVVGSVPSNEMQNSEEKLWEKIGVDYVEPIRSEINREVGKKLEKITGRKFNPKEPDVVVLIDLKRNETRIQLKSLYVSGGYKKLVRGIPQTRWLCMNCNGKGCVDCGGKGKRYKTSVQEIVGKPLVKSAEGKDHAFHGSGREDIDARCLDYRPFVLEILKPKKRKIDLKKIERSINKSGKVEVLGLKFSDKDYVRKIKSDRHDKTYSAEVEFEKPVDKKLLPKIKSLKNSNISQQTPTRVKHRRADILRKRGVKSISYKILGKKKMKLVVRAQAGLYIKELINGDEGRTKPSIAEFLNNKVKRIVLDVIKIHPVK